MAASDLTADPALCRGRRSDLPSRRIFTFLEKSPTCLKIANFKKALLSRGYTYLPEDTAPRVLSRRKAFTTRNGSSIIAFRTPDPAPTGFQITASHSDSRSFGDQGTRSSKRGKPYIRLNAEPHAC